MHPYPSCPALVVMWFAGLRGAISFALSLNMPGEHKDIYVTTTLSLVIFTTIVCGGLTERVLTKMGMKVVSPPRNTSMLKGGLKYSPTASGMKDNTSSSGGGNNFGAMGGGRPGSRSPILEKMSIGSGSQATHVYYLLIT